MHIIALNLGEMNYFLEKYIYLRRNIISEYSNAKLDIEVIFI